MGGYNVGKQLGNGQGAKDALKKAWGDTTGQWLRAFAKYLFLTVPLRRAANFDGRSPFRHL